jgi:A/G-specific adenine glycosylase
MNPQKAGLHNQAIMEFGALQCVPQNPDCNRCPFIYKCKGYAIGNPQQFPVKQHKTKTRDRYFNYFYISIEGEYTYLHCRTQNDIWKGLFELPMIETEQPMDFVELKERPAFKKLFQDTGQPVLSVEKSGVRHVLSHQILHATFYKAEIQMENAALRKYLKIQEKDLENYPVPKLIHNYLSEIV